MQKSVSHCFLIDAWLIKKKGGGYMNYSTPVVTPVDLSVCFDPISVMSHSSDAASCYTDNALAVC